LILCGSCPDPGGDLVCAEMDEDAAEGRAEGLSEMIGRGYHVKEAQLIWNE